MKNQKKKTVRDQVMRAVLLFKGKKVSFHLKMLRFRNWNLMVKKILSLLKKQTQPIVILQIQRKKKNHLKFKKRYQKIEKINDYKNKQKISLLKNKKNGRLPQIERMQSDKQRRNQIVIDEKWIMQMLKKKGVSSNFIIPFEQLGPQLKVGEGGYGDVFRSQWLGQDVAIKEYGKNCRFRKKKIADFFQEVIVISNLRHPNVLLYMGVCIHEFKLLMITEYLEGGSLFDLLHKKHSKLSEERKLLISEDIALGMYYLHERKVMHCDLKSSNILIDSS
eukprot:TRINITY_DN5802_c0_g1_i10.p1 TRINITY_DN5802_c0_g1~~TRINITY_DN5802_c0_g1_i10.p1  ORF type:complete len:277 (-),score=26.68 TRINITY_DN5802_c0_g1_i10:643-1473(-)